MCWLWFRNAKEVASQFAPVGSIEAVLGVLEFHLLDWEMMLKRRSSRAFWSIWSRRVGERVASWSGGNKVYPSLPGMWFPTWPNLVAGEPAAQRGFCTSSLVVEKGWNDLSVKRARPPGHVPEPLWTTEHSACILALQKLQLVMLRIATGSNFPPHWKQYSLCERADRVATTLGCRRDKGSAGVDRAGSNPNGPAWFGNEVGWGGGDGGHRWDGGELPW